jgi:DNA-3-methyladenine glycosylase II
MPHSLFAEHLPAAREHLGRADPVLAKLVATLPEPSLEVEVEEDRFLSLVGAIVSQQLSVKAAATIEARLHALFPEGMTPAGILAVEPDLLRQSGLSGAKTRYVRDLAEQVATGTLNLAALDNVDDEGVVQLLTAVKGIGRWTAEMFLIFSLGRPDVLPVGDLGFRAALRTLYGLADLPGKDESEAIASLWHPYCSIATLYLWRSRRASAPLAAD